MKGRNQSLDVLRGVAVLLVIFHHYAIDDESFLHVGIVGVDLFFVLSGFLISGLLFSEFIKTGTIRLRRFYVRRGLKLYPAFYVFLIATLPMTHIFGPARLASEALFLQSYTPHIWHHTWSLSVEEMFYLCLPLLLLVLAKRKSFAAIPFIAVGLIALCAILRSFAPLTEFSHAHLRFDALFAGVALGYFRHFRGEMFARLSRARWMLPLALLLLVPCSLNRRAGPSLNDLTLTSTLLGFAALVWWSQGITIRAPLVAGVGRYSYSIYLWHMPLALFFSLRTMSAENFLLYILVTIVVGITAATLVELPVLHLRDRWFPAMSHVTTASPKRVDDCWPLLEMRRWSKCT